MTVRDIYDGGRAAMVRSSAASTASGTRLQDIFLRAMEDDDGGV